MMTQLNPAISILMDEDKTHHMTYVTIEKGLVAGAFEWRGQLFVRAQLTTPNQTWEEAWAKIRGEFGFQPGDVRTEHLIHQWDDGTEMRQAFLGDYEAAE
jgi:hypothetical protein